MKKKIILVVTIFVAGFYSCSNYNEAELDFSPAPEDTTLKVIEASPSQNELISHSLKRGGSQNNVSVDIHGNAYFISNGIVKMYNTDSREVTEMFIYSGMIEESEVSAIAVNSEQNVFLMMESNRLYQFDVDGQLLRDFSNNGLIFSSERISISGISIAPNDDTFVLISENDAQGVVLKKIATNGRITDAANLGDDNIHTRGGGVYCAKGQYVYFSSTLSNTSYDPLFHRYAQVLKGTGESTIELPGIQFSALGCALNNNKLYILRSTDNTIHAINPTNQQMILITKIPTTAILEDGTLMETGKPVGIFPTPDADAFYILYDSQYLTKLTL